MNFTFGGIRGSFPVCGQNYLKYGGATSAVLVEGTDGTQILLDAGTGVRDLLPSLRAGCTVFLTHFHLDHVLGLPALQNRKPAVLFSARPDAHEVLRQLFSPPLWPVEPDVDCATLPGHPVEIGGLCVRAMPVEHPDGCMAYRVDEAATGDSLVLATDVEWGAMEADAREAFRVFASKCGVLLFDTHFTPQEIGDFRGWGHSTWEDAADVARQCDAGRWIPVHHAPARTDAEVDALYAEWLGFVPER